MQSWPLHEQLYSADQVRQLDALTIQAGTPGFELMKQAGRMAFRHLLRRWPDIRSVSILCGGGNNGGDGYVMAGLASRKGIQVQLISLSDPEKLTGEAHEAWLWACDRDCQVQLWQQNMRLTGEVIVDAMLGTGLTGNIRGHYQEAINQVNQCNCPVLAVDIPSGLCADKGVVLGDTVKASLTVTFIGKKTGLMTGQGPEYSGDCRFEPLCVPDSVRRQIQPVAQMVNADAIGRLLKPRSRTAHKGHCGKVFLVGGDLGFAGAIMLASQTCARSGAGLIKVMTRPEHIPALIARQPELMAQGIESVHQLDPWLKWCDVIVMGPGLGQSGWGQQIWQKVIHSDKPMLLDADALNLLAVNVDKTFMPDKAQRNWVLTPHPGEAARLSGMSVQEVENNRLDTVVRLSEKYQATVLLKGAGTLIAADGLLSINNSGNPGMASGGMGDVLSGLIGALLAQGLSGYDAACLGAQVHGLAADRLAAHYGERGLLASDLIDVIRVLLNPECEQNAG